LNVPQLEKEIGIEVYATKTQGIGGRLRQFPEDFRVEEILANGSIARIEPDNIAHITGFGRYLICVLVKRNMDTLQAVQTIANRLGVDSDRIQVGGMKDANALTAQHVSISRMLPEQAANIETSKLRLCPLTFSNEKIHSNLLFGNQFHVTIRAIDHEESTIMKHVENANNELSKLGDCPNFYGHQRFGTSRPITHLVGKHILLGEWEEAAFTFLAKPSPYEHPESREVRQRLWDTRNYKDALSHFPPRLTYEHQMLRHLARQTRDFTGAFHRLPKKLSQLFVQAYQSYLFNRFLSERIQHGQPLDEPQRNEYKLTVDNREQLALPLIGYVQGVSAGEQGEIEKRILQEEGIRFDNFKISAMPQISSRGSLRTALMPIRDQKVDRTSKDNANPGKMMMSLDFSLMKGSYATVVLREFMKPTNPIEAGF
jgi:tRNA pseudouridine13 synthase